MDGAAAAAAAQRPEGKVESGFGKTRLRTRGQEYIQ